MTLARPTWTMLDSRVDPSMLGFIPDFLSLDDPRPAAEQFNTAYAHGGGWRPMEGWTLNTIGDRPTITYPGDPPLKAIAGTQLREENIFLFLYARVCIIQPNGTFAISQMD